MVKYQNAVLDSVFHALADPSRRAILRLLSERERSIGELVPAFPISFVAVSNHMKVLEQAGLVIRRKQGRHQMCSLDKRGLDAAQDWLDAHERFWTERLDALDAVVAEMKADDTGS
ncbi:HTH-type transcriptional regulator [Starkeya nomas]|uniref:HTH-type transcriptional regulator n=1 Tax=Starkeya nomas TaxID=2666134 RepID=A0A5S9Q4Y4_9HYPH|nr:HTH-type transcriptional regulator [Starkeya nomas]